MSGAVIGLVIAAILFIGIAGASWALGVLVDTVIRIARGIKRLLASRP